MDFRFGTHFKYGYDVGKVNKLYSQLPAQIIDRLFEEPSMKMVLFNDGVLQYETASTLDQHYRTKERLQEIIDEHSDSPIFRKFHPHLALKTMLTLSYTSFCFMKRKFPNIRVDRCGEAEHGSVIFQLQHHRSPCKEAVLNLMKPGSLFAAFDCCHKGIMLGVGIVGETLDRTGMIYPNWPMVYEAPAVTEIKALVYPTFDDIFRRPLNGSYERVTGGKLIGEVFDLVPLRIWWHREAHLGFQTWEASEVEKLFRSFMEGIPDDMYDMKLEC